MHGINAAGAVVNPLNTRLDAGTLAYILGHSQTKVLLADTSLAALAQQAIHALPAQNRPRLVDVPDPVFAGGRGSRPKTADPERETPHVENKTPCVEMNTPVDKGAGHIAAASVVADCSYEELLEQGRSIAGGICGGDCRCGEACACAAIHRRAGHLVPWVGGAGECGMCGRLGERGGKSRIVN